MADRDPDIESAINAARMVASNSHDQFGDFASMHEAYGVLAEEVQEFLDAVRLKQTNDLRASKCYLEGIDIASVALRIAAQAKRVTR